MLPFEILKSFPKIFKFCISFTGSESLSGGSVMVLPLEIVKSLPERVKFCNSLELSLSLLTEIH